MSENLQSIDKNKYLIQIDQVKIVQKTEQLIQELGWILSHCQMASKDEDAFYASSRFRNRNLTSKEIEEKKFKNLQTLIGEKCNKYKQIFKTWTAMRTEKNDIKLWDQTLQDMIQQFQSYINGEIKQSNPITNISTFIASYISLLFTGIHGHYYLPSLLQVTLLGINEIDELNQKASIILKLELKVKVPQNAKYLSNIFKSLSKLKMYVKSKKMQNLSVATFLNQQIQSQKTKLFGDAVINSQEESSSIWTQISEYYHSKNKIYQGKSLHPQNEKQQIIKFEGLIFSAYLNNVQVQIQSHLRYSPCDLLDLKGFVQISDIIEGIQLWKDDTHQSISEILMNSAVKIQIKPNLIQLNDHNKDERNSMINTSPCISIDDFNLTEHLIKMEVSNKIETSWHLNVFFLQTHWEENQQQNQNEDSLIVTDQQQIYSGDTICHFHFPIHKKPGKGVAMIFIPMTILGFLNLAIFKQDSSVDGLADKIANIATISISFIAVQTLYRQMLKKSAFTFTSLLIQLLTLTSVLCLLSTLLVDVNDDKKASRWNNTLLWISEIIMWMNMIYPLIIFISARRNFYSQRKGIRQTKIIFPGDEGLTQNLQEGNFQNIKNVDRDKSGNSKKKSETTVRIWEQEAYSCWMQAIMNVYTSDEFKDLLENFKEAIRKFDFFLEQEEYRKILIRNEEPKQML